MILVIKVNLYKPNGISHFYKLGQSISILRFAKWYFFISISNRTFYKPE